MHDVLKLNKQYAFSECLHIELLELFVCVHYTVYMIVNHIINTDNWPEIPFVFYHDDTRLQLNFAAYISDRYK